MDRYLSISRAARLVGVKRGTLQKRIQAGEILTFEGMLFIDDLLKLYPQTQLEDNTMIERSVIIKNNAVGKYVHELSVLPNAEVLTARVSRLSNELTDSKALANKYIKITEILQSKLTQIPDDEPNLNEIRSWLNDTINTPVESDITKDQLIASDTLLSLMTAHIRILPSGHDFFAEGTSTILEAGLRAGLALNYACSNGNCGQCKARLISGEVNKTSPHDYVIADSDKAKGHILMCCNSAITDVTLEAIEASKASDIAQQSLTAKVKKLDTTRDDVALLHLKTPRTQRLRFLAGQTVTLGGADYPVSEQSVSSCPCDDMNLHFQIPKISGDDFSDFVFNQLQNGDSLEINGPHGEFVLNENSNHSLTFVAWHTGFAPIRSLVEHAMALDVAETINLIWITACDEDRYLDNLCRSWNDALDNFTYTTITADLNNTDIETIVSGIIDQIDELDANDIYVAGNTALLDNCTNVLQQKQFNLAQLKLDLITHA